MQGRLTKLPGLVWRTIFKSVIARARYGGEAGHYDAERFWKDRFAKYGAQLRGSGHEGLTEAENRARYEGAGRVLSRMLSESGIRLDASRILDIGCGPGFFTQLLADHGAGNYVGLDITDELFPTLKQRFPSYDFVQADITSQLIPGRFDLILMIDVLEHIVTEEKMAYAMRAIADAISSEGLVIIGPAFKKAGRGFFYVRHWTEANIRNLFPDFDLAHKDDFGYGDVLGLRAPKKDT